MRRAPPACLASRPVSPVLKCPDLVPLTMLKFCDFDALAAMHLTLDFGHDTDSYAQLLGAMAGAVHGMGLFPDSMTSAVQSRLMVDYGETVEDWVQTITSAAAVWAEPSAAGPRHATDRPSDRK